MSTMAIQFDGVSKTYRHFKLDDIRIDLPHGHIMGFIGPNGAGKSTTLRILMGLVHQDRGEVKVLGRPMPEQQVAVKRDVGYVSEDMRLYDQATLAWHMEFIRSIYPSWNAAYAGSLLRRFSLHADQRIKGLSHGQRVKAALLIVLARRPRLLILDEPTTGLDPVARSEVLEELMEVLADEERTILFSSHDTRDVEQMSDQITFIDRGRIIDCSDKETFLDRWRRLRMEVPQELVLPSLPGIYQVKRNSRMAVVTTNEYHPEMASAFAQAGATVTSIENLTLEEIFIANVRNTRGGEAA